MKKILSMMLVLSVAWVTQSMAEEQTDAAEVSEWVEHFLERKRQAIETTVDFEPGEAESFWPLFDVYAKEIGPVVQELATLLDRYRTESETLSEEDANEIIDALLATNTESIAVQREYVTRVRQVLPAKKVLQVSYIVLTSAP